MQRKSLKKFLVSAGLVCVLAPAALAASVIMNRGNGHAILGDTLQDAVEKVLLFGFGGPEVAPAAAANANSAGKAQIPQGAGAYISPARLADLLRYNVDPGWLDLGDGHGPGGVAAHGARADAVLAVLADVLGVPGQQIAATASNGTPGGASGGAPGMSGSGQALSGAGGGGAGSGGISGGGGSGGSGSDGLILPGTADAPTPGAAAVTVVPLPATVWMLFAAFGALGMAARRRGVA